MGDRRSPRLSGVMAPGAPTRNASTERTRPANRTHRTPWRNIGRSDLARRGRRRSARPGCRVGYLVRSWRRYPGSSRASSQPFGADPSGSFVRNPTHAPGGTSSPPCGFCAWTTAVAPTGSPSGTPSSSITVSPLSSTIRIASGSRLPVTTGTATVGSPVLTQSATLTNAVVAVVVETVVAVVLETAAGSSSSLQAPPTISASAVTATIAAPCMHA
jgi:hypothetical protein